MVCACGENWLIEGCDLRTGIVRTILHPLAFDFKTTLNRVGQGSMTLATREVVVRDIWPHLTSIYISRIAGGDASRDNPRVEFAGMIEEFDADDDGTTKVGLKSIEYYLHRREIKNRRVFNDTPQTDLGAALVALAEPNGIPLTAIAEASQYGRDRTYERWDHKKIGEAIEEMTNVINGFDWELRHARQDGAWSTQMIFRDYVGTDRGVVLRSDREAFGYGLSVDAKDHATYVTAIGSGQERDQMTSVAVDETGVYPEFDESPAWTDVSRQRTLDAHAQGYLEEHRDPVAIPDVTLRGLDPDPASVRLGDTVQVETEYGAVTYHGPARVVVINWALAVDEPETRTLEFSPLTRASESVLNQTPTTEPCADCDSDNGGPDPNGPNATEGAA